MVHAGSQAVSPSGGRRWPGRLTSRPPRMGKACKPRPLSPVGHPPLWAGLTQPGQGLGAKSTGPKKEALSPRPTQMPCQGPQPAGVVTAGTSRLRKGPTSRLPSVSRLGPLALRGRFLDCVPLGPFLWAACLSPFKPPNRDPQAVACGQQTLTSQLGRPRVGGSPVGLWPECPPSGPAPPGTSWAPALGACSGHVARSARPAGGHRSGGG